MSTSLSVQVEDDGEEKTSDIYQGPKSFQVPKEVDATKSTEEELEQIASFVEFPKMKVYQFMK